jgi:Right handed beta helix region
MRKKHVRLGLCLAAILSLCFAAQSEATLRTVTDVGDSNAPGQLRTLIGTANPGDTILVPTGAMITLALGTLTINKDVIIQGGAAATTFIDGNGVSGPVIVTAFVQVSISGVTIRNGDIGIGNIGGLLTLTDSIVTENQMQGVISLGVLNVMNSTISHNGKQGVVSFALNPPTTIDRSTISDNDRTGLFVLGAAVISNSTVAGNGLGLFGGVANIGFLNLTNSTLSGNGSILGGGIANLSTKSIPSILAVTNCTLSGNEAGFGGGLLNAALKTRAALVALNNVTIADNTAFGAPGATNPNESPAQADTEADTFDSIMTGIHSVTDAVTSGGSNTDTVSQAATTADTAAAQLAEVQDAVDDVMAQIAANGIHTGGGVLNLNVDSASVRVTTQNTIIALNSDLGGNPTSPDCFSLSGGIVSKGYNLVGESDECNWPAGAPGDQIGTIASPIDPKLGPLQNNDGPFTQALLNGSPALDTGNPQGCRDSQGTVLTIDERHALRPVNGVCDIGAYERALRNAPVLSPVVLGVLILMLSGLGAVRLRRSRALRA